MSLSTLFSQHFSAHFCWVIPYKLDILKMQATRHEHIFCRRDFNFFPTVGNEKLFHNSRQISRFCLKCQDWVSKSNSKGSMANLTAYYTSDCQHVIPLISHLHVIDVNWLKLVSQFRISLIDICMCVNDDTYIQFIGHWKPTNFNTYMSHSHCL